MTSYNRHCQNLWLQSLAFSILLGSKSRLRTKHIFSHSAHELKKAPMMIDGVTRELENGNVLKCRASEVGHPSSKVVREWICNFRVSKERESKDERQSRNECRK